MYFRRRSAAVLPAARAGTQNPLARGLVAWMPGRAYDASRLARRMVVAGGLAYGERSDARFGRASVPLWDGVNDEATIAGFPFLPAFTLLAWVYVPSSLAEGYYGPVHRGGLFDFQSNFAFGFRSNRALFCYARNNGTLVGKESVTLDAEAWSRIGVAWQAGAQAYFVNGPQVDSGSAGNGADGSEPLTFGGLLDSANNRWLSSPTFDTRVYNRVLSAAEIALDYSTQMHQLFERRPRSPMVFGQQTVFIHGTAGQWNPKLRAKAWF